MLHMLSCIRMHTHIYSWKLSPGFVLLAKVCPWSQARWHIQCLGPGNTKEGKYHCTVDLLFDWFGISCVATDNFCFYLQNTNPIQAKGGQWYSDTSLFSILSLGIRCFINVNQGSYLQYFIFFVIYKWAHVLLKVIPNPGKPYWTVTLQWTSLY